MKSIEERINAQNYIEPEMVKAAFEFWFSDSDHLRSPFPEYIRERLKQEATHKLLDWSGAISDKARKEINDEILAEKFEEIIFEAALPMVLTEDEKLTIRYPFMPRIGDLITEKDAEGNQTECRVTDRYHFKKGDTAFMKIKLKNTFTQKERETEFELPE
ncbi:MAG: hypothetical protein LC117_06495 [Bacteroidia bacterium]|nr:hypothetical protein [Bacteroidia bacterium]MCZ2277561.1 hypothetical protein [Bacteroidia bacterium]